MDVDVSEVTGWAAALAVVVTAVGRAVALVIRAYRQR